MQNVKKRRKKNNKLNHFSEFVKNLKKNKFSRIKLTIDEERIRLRKRCADTKDNIMIERNLFYEICYF